MKRIFIIICVLTLFISLSPVINGDETDIYSSDKLSEFLDEDVAEKMEESGLTEGDISGIWQVIADTLTDSAGEMVAPLRCLALMTAGAVVISVMSSYDKGNGLIQLGVIAGTAVMATEGISEFIKSLASVCGAMSTFLMGAVPVYAGLLITSGNPAAGTSYGSVTLILANIISLLSSKIIIPSMSVLLGLGIAGTFSSYKVSGIIESVYKPVKWLLTFAVTAFSGLISLQTFVSTRIGAAGIKTAKQVVSSAVPVVGSALGDGIEAVRQSMALIRTGAGAFGLVAELIIFAPVFISGAMWFLCFTLASIVGEIFGADKLKTFTDSCLMIVKMILAVAVSVFVLSVVTAAVVVCAGY